MSSVPSTGSSSQLYSQPASDAILERLTDALHTARGNRRAVCWIILGELDYHELQANTAWRSDVGARYGLSLSDDGVRFRSVPVAVWRGVRRHFELILEPLP